MTRMFLASVAALALSGTTSAALEVRESTDGGLAVWRDGKPVVTSVTVDRGGVKADDVRSSKATLADGTRVWNRWSEVADRRFRLEVAQRADGAVEITMSGTVDAESKVRRRMLEMKLAGDVFRGNAFAALRSILCVYRRETGVFDDAMKEEKYRWLASSGLTFDFNPIGPGDDFAAFGSGPTAHADIVRAFATVGPDGADWTIRQGDEAYVFYGGYIGAKTVIREGGFEDYDKYHLLRKYHYIHPIAASHLLAFGSPRRGAVYSEGNVIYTATRGFGWENDFSRDNNNERKPAVGYREGAYYSALTGRQSDRYRFGNLSDGYYLFTVGAGNYAGVSNRFSVAVGDVKLLTDVTVPSGVVRTVTRAVHVKGGRLDVALTGRWLLSTLALQPLLGDGEDFSVARGFWVTKGFEPGVIYRSDEWSPFTPGIADETRVLPVPGTECAATPHAPPAPVELPDPDAPALAWMKNARIFKLFGNTQTLAQYDDPAVRERAFDKIFADRDVNAVLISGTLSRHTMPAREEAMIKSVGELTKSLHGRGMKAFDHIDATIVWNSAYGFRMMMERPDRLMREWNTDLRTDFYCVSNPDWRERFYGQLRKTVATGVDALQIDELYHWHRGCTCRHCCELFERETGWKVPLNECDPAWYDHLSPFRRRWRDWRIRHCTNFFVELRQRTKDLNPNLVLSAYTYTGGFVSSGSGDIGQELLDLSRAVNFFGVEVMSRGVLKSARAELPFRRAQNIYTFAYGAPVWDWYYSSDAPTDYAAWAMSEMVRQSPMLSDVPKIEGYPNYAGFNEAKGAMRRSGAEPVARIALLFSSRTRDLNVVREWTPALFGIAQAMEALHVPYEFVPDVNLTAKHLAKYRKLVLSGFERLTDADSKLLDDYVRAGGQIVNGIEGSTNFCQRSLVSNPYSADPDIFDFNPDPAEEAAFRARVRAAVGDAMWWNVSAPDKVATSVWREKSGALALHFLNLTGVSNRVGEPISRFAPDPAYPPLAEDITIDIPVEGLAAAAAFSPDFAGERPLKAVRAGDRLLVTLPADALKTYTLVRVK